MKNKNNSKKRDMNPTKDYVVMTTETTPGIEQENTDSPSCSCGGSCEGNCNCDGNCGCENCKEKIMNKAQSLFEKSKAFLKENTNDENLIKVGIGVCVLGIVYVYFKD